LAIRYLRPKEYRDKAGHLHPTTNVMGGETDWFLLPYTFGAAVGRILAEQKLAGLPGFRQNGFEKMITWLVDTGELTDAMCY